MSHTIPLTKLNYLATTAVISAGILSGCDYCIPVLIALLTVPVVNILINHILKFQQPTLNQLHGFKESAS